MIIREVEKNPLAVLVMKDPGQLPTSSFTVCSPSTMVTSPDCRHTPEGVDRMGGGGGGGGGREGK